MFEKVIYTQRRKKLKQFFQTGLLLFMGNKEVPYNYKANTYRFRQDSSFLYLFGINQPDLAAIIDIDNDKTIVFGNNIDLEDIIWTGPMPSLKELASNAGINEVREFNALSNFIKNALEQHRTIHFLPSYRCETTNYLAELLQKPITEISQLCSQELIKAMVELRSKKEACEIKQIEAMLDVAYDMHLAAMKMALSGKTEKEIAGIVEGNCLSKSYAPSFPVICSVRGEVLHNTSYQNTLKKGQLLLVDAGAESDEHYASDITRTTPVDGQFTGMQKNIFDIVLKANKKVQEIAKPGVFYREAHLGAAKVIAQGLKELGILKGDIEEIVASGAHACFFPHGVGHMLGLDVHDMENYGENNVGYDHEIQRSEQFGTAFLRMGRRLQEGFVVTDEPGIYFIPELIALWEKEKKFADFINYNEAKKYIGFGGIRLEDDLLITKDGCRVLGKPIPYII